VSAIGVAVSIDDVIECVAASDHAEHVHDRIVDRPGIDEALLHAIADGVESAAMSMLEATLFVLRRGPALLLWMTVLGLPVWWMIRRHPLWFTQRPGHV
jgi:hypothetical protein